MTPREKGDERPGARTRARTTPRSTSSATTSVDAEQESATTRRRRWRTEDVAEEDLDEEDLDEEELDDEDLDDEDTDDEDPRRGTEHSEEEELEEVVSAETQEWDGLEEAEEDGQADETPTIAASAGQRVKQAGSAITSSFEKVGRSGRFATPRFPIWLRFLTAIFVIVGSVGTATRRA